jgi:hypothetical protein
MLTVKWVLSDHGWTMLYDTVGHFVAFSVIPIFSNGDDREWRLELLVLALQDRLVYTRMTTQILHSDLLVRVK